MSVTTKTATTIPLKPAPQAPFLDERFIAIKRALVRPKDENKVSESSFRLLRTLEHEADIINKTGPSMVPEIDFNTVLAEHQGRLPASFTSLVRERGCVILRNVVPEAQASAWEAELIDYTTRHRAAGGYPKDNPQNWSLWWTRPQVQMRSHPRLLAAMACVSQLWHVQAPNLPVDLTSQVVYPDRFRIRYPSKDADYTLPAHLDSDAIERWKDPENRPEYAAMLEEDWESCNGRAADHRINAKSDLYGIKAACTCWRSLQVGCRCRTQTQGKARFDFCQI